MEQLPGADAYSYVFDGQWGYLDHALGPAAVGAQVTGVAEYHINADEPSVLDYNLTSRRRACSRACTPRTSSGSRTTTPCSSASRPNSPAVVDAAFEKTSVSCGDGNASLTIGITDRDAEDTHAVTVKWGDGTSDTTVDPASSPLTLDHTYAAAGRYTATVTVTDSHGHVTTEAVAVTVEYTSSGILAPVGSSWTARSGSTIPVKVAYTDCDGSVPTDVNPVVTLSRNGTTVVTGTAVLVDGQWKYELSTRGLAAGTYTVTVTVPETGQTDTATLTLRR